MRKAVDRSVDVDVLILASDHSSEANQQRQAATRTQLAEELPEVTVRVIDRVLPWCGTVVDPSLNYDAGEGLLLVEQEEIPNHHRHAAVTENSSFVAGLWQYFDLLWRHESEPVE